MAARERSSLADLAAESGAPVPCAGNLPLDLGDPGFAWFIERGAVDLFVVESRDGVEQSAPQHVLRANAGRLLPGVAPQEEDTTLGLIVKGFPSTVLRRLPLSSLAEIANAELAAQVDAWLFAARSPRDHRSSRGDRLPVACGAGHVRIRRRPR